jgi:ABC-2 type transport system permease protein
MVIVGAALFFASALVSEFEERTALLMFPRPMKKTSFFIGKVLACYIVCGAIIVMYYMVSMVISLLNTGTVYPAAFASLGLALLFMAAVGGFALLMSSVLKKGSTAIIMTIAAMLLVFNMIDGILFAVDIEPVFDLIYAGLDISNVVDGAVTVSNGSIGFGMTGTLFYPSHALAVSVMGIWAAVTTFLAVILFGRREF